MEIWEVIKELTENPSKRFQAIFHEGVIWEVCKHENGSIECIYGKGDLGECRGVLGLGKIEMEAKWEEVKEPVDFMTAFKAFREGKTIYVKDGELSGGKFTYFPKEPYENHRCFSEEDIANGEWYIED